MRRFCVIVLFFFALSACYLQAQSDNERTKYFNFNYSGQTLKMGDNELYSLGNEYGGGFSYGKTYYVHPKPIAGMIRFGIDATFIDLNYSFYKMPYEYDDDDYYYEDESYDFKFHQAELGVQVGPSITVTPIRNLKAHGYFRYAPCVSALYDTDAEAINASFGSFFTSGVSVSYGIIGLGIEARWGNSKFSDTSFDYDYEYKIDWDKWERYEDVSPSNKFKTSGFRVYLQLRF
ncbi:MAG: hypothetical protein LUE98_04235 [Tannerellaceae bacterium]|nr:hypothetical protein [Tannerellaceae bacterium]